MEVRPERKHIYIYHSIYRNCMKPIKFLNYRIFLCMVVSMIENVCNDFKVSVVKDIKTFNTHLQLRTFVYNIRKKCKQLHTRKK